ncbi:putative reverse transcriptase domain-containing protein [Tanacetum coccineum]
MLVELRNPLWKRVIVEDYVSFEEDVEQGIDNAYETQYDVQSSEDAGTDDDDEDDDFLVDEGNEILEPDVDVYLFSISMDVPFDNTSVTNLVPDDVLEGEDVDVINLDGFNSDPGNDNETSNYRRRMLAELSKEMEGVMNTSGQWKYSFYTGHKFNTAKEVKDRVYLHSIKSKRNLKLYKNDSVRVSARCDGKMHVFTMSQGTGPTRPSESSGPTTRSKKRKNTGTNDDSQACSSALDAHDKWDLYHWVCTSKAFRAIAEREIRGDHVLQYSMLRDYVVEACKRELSGIDGAFMKEPFPGQVLAAVGLDSNNRIYPLAYSLVEAKSKSSWCRFLQCLGDDIDLHSNSNFTFINDRLKVEPNLIYCSKTFVRSLIVKSDLLLKPVVTLLEYIREYCMKRIVNVQSVIDKCTACWNMALNDRATPPLGAWVNPCYWLTTWRETCSHKVEPINRTNYWEKSTCPTTLLPPKHHVQVGRPKKKRKRSKHEDEPFAKDGKLSENGRTITCQSCGNIGHNKATYKGQGGNNAEASGSVSKQAQQVEPAVGQDGSGRSGVGVVIGLFVADCAGGAGVGVGSQGSSHTRWTKRRVKTKIISSQKTTPTQHASQPSTNSQVPVTATRNAYGREMGDGIPTQSSAAGGAIEWPFILVSRAKVIENQVKAFSVISISSRSSEESVGTSTARVILFGTIPTTTPSTAPTIDLPIIHDDTPLIPTDTPTISPIAPTIPPIVPTIQYTSPFICTDSSDSDTLDLPPSQDPYKVTIARWRSRVAARSSPPSSPIRRFYLHHPDYPADRLSLFCLVSRFLLVNPTVPSPTRYCRCPSLETSSDSYSDSSSDSSLRHSSGYAILETLCDSPTANFERPSRKRYRSPFVPVRGALSPIRADLLPPPKRIRDSNLVTDLEVSSEDSYGSYVPREVGLGVDVEDSSEPYTQPDVDSNVQADIDECIAYADAIRARGIDDRDAIETAAAKEVESSVRGTIEVEVNLRVESVVDYDVRESVREDVPDHVTTDGAVIESEQRLQGYRITGVDLEVTTRIERISVLERDNTRLRGMLDVESQRVDRLQRGLSLAQRELRQIRHFRFYDRVRLGRLEACVRRYSALKAYDAATNPETEAEIENEQQDDHVEEMLIMGTPLNFKGTKGVVGLTRWFKKMETVFHISNCPLRYQVKYASCTLMEGALTWWNLHKRTVGVDAAYAMTWKELMKLMTEVYCPRNEIQKMETELWNLTVKGNDLTAYNQRLQELTLLCTKMVPKEEDKKVKGYAIKNDENKRRFNNNQRDNRAQQQPPFKRQNVNGHNVARAYTVENNVERKGYAGSLPYYSKCRLHHEGPCMVKCGNCKRVGHMTRDCRTIIVATPQRAPIGNQMGNTCYECGRPGHYRNECLKLRNQSHGNKTENKTRNNKAKARAYAIGGGGANTDSNVVTGTFLLNNRYASMLFDSCADRSFVSTTFSALLDVVPSTLDTSHQFDIDLMPVELGSFDVIVGMDWLAKYHAVIVYDEKIVRIPYGDEVLIIEGDGCNGGITTRKSDDESEEKRLEDVPIVRDFPKVFPEDLRGLPPT